MQKVDDALILRAQGGDRAALDEVVRRTVRLVKWHASRAAGSNQTMFDEAVSFGLGAVLDAVRKFRPGKSKWSTYVMLWIRARVQAGLRGASIANEDYVEHFAELASEDGTRVSSDWSVQAVMDEVPQDAEHLDDIIDHGVLVRRLRRKVDALPEQERDAIVMRFFEEMDLKAVAERQGVTRQAIAKRLERTVAKLKVSMKPQHEAENER